MVGSDFFGLDHIGRMFVDVGDALFVELVEFVGLFLVALASVVNAQGGEFRYLFLANAEILVGDLVPFDAS